MKVPEPQWYIRARNALKDRVRRKTINVYKDGKREKIKLYKMNDIVQLERYKLSNRKKDTLLELSEYLHVDQKSIAEKLKASTDSIEEAYNKKERKTSEDIMEFYSHTPEYLLGLMRVNLLFRHSAKRTNISLSIAKHYGTKTMVDYGAGTGKDCISFKKEGFDVTHVDVPGKLTQFCEWRFRQRGLDIEMVDTRDFADVKKQFDVINCFDVLEHIKDPMRLLKVFYDKLHTEGLLFIFADFDNRGTAQHLPENEQYYGRLDSEIEKIGFSKILDLGMTGWIKNK